MQYAQEDVRKSWYYTISTGMLLSLAFVLSVSNYLPLIFRLISSICTGLLLSRMFVIYHDYNHQAIFLNSRLAHVLMTLFGLIALAPISIWKHVHDHHHDHNSKFAAIVLGSFPTITKREYLLLNHQMKIKYLLIRHPITILLSYLTVFLISFCLYPFFESPKKHKDCLLAFLLHTIVAISLIGYGGPTVFILGWMIPFLIKGMLGGYIFYAQHNFPGVKLKSASEWDYVFAALNSSSFIKMNRFWTWVTANVGFHHVHHINSRIPFYRLPEAMAGIPDLQTPTETTLSLRDIRNCLRLKVWDEDKQELVGV